MNFCTPEGEPVKVGAVLLRKHGGEYEVLVVKPNPKEEGYNTPMGLVRGTRKYFDEPSQKWVDAPREGPQPAGVLWEPYYETMASEAYEEAGLHPKLLPRQKIYDMGARDFISNKKEPYPIHWYAVLLNENTQAMLPHEGPGPAPAMIPDALKSEWMPISKMNELAARDYKDTSQDRISEDYVTIAKIAIANFRTLDAGLKPGRFERVQGKAAQIDMDKLSEKGAHHRY